MHLKQHLSESLHLENTPSPWPRMVLSALSVSFPLIVGYARNDLSSAIYGALFGFIMILNDHFGPLKKRIFHLLVAYFFMISGFLLGILFASQVGLLIVGLFCFAFIIGKSKGFGFELERLLLFTTLQFLTASQTPHLHENFFPPMMYASLSLINYFFCLCLVYLLMKHEPNFAPKSKRQLWREMMQKKGTNRYAFILASTACVGFSLAQYLNVERGYWVVGTILIVMMPSHRESFYKSFQRLFGTLLGVIIASLLIKVGRDPLILIPFCTLAAFFAPSGLMKNYWLGNLFIASLILFLLEISSNTHHRGDFDLAFLRLADIGMGCFLGIIGTVIAFPGMFKSDMFKS